MVSKWKFNVDSRAFKIKKKYFSNFQDFLKLEQKIYDFFKFLNFSMTFHRIMMCANHGFH